jgi:hypothetical protein
MSPTEPTLPPIPPRAADRRVIWRVAGVSLLFLVVGLGLMYFLFILKGRATVGLENLGDLPPTVPPAQAEPNRVRLLFTANGALLSPEMNEISRSPTPYDRATAILQALLRGPRSSALRSPIPRGVKLRGLYISDGSATVDFTAELRDGLHGNASAEVLCVYSIVNTLLLNCSNFKNVTLLIEGRPVDTLQGYLDLSRPLVENLAVMAPEERREAALK